MRVYYPFKQFYQQDLTGQLSSTELPCLYHHFFYLFFSYWLNSTARCQTASETSTKPAKKAGLFSKQVKRDNTSGPQIITLTLSYGKEMGRTQKEQNKIIIRISLRSTSLEGYCNLQSRTAGFQLQLASKLFDVV